jgi:hypothetical protein
MHSVAKTPLKPIAIEQRQKQLEIFLLPVVRGCRHQEKMPCQAREELSQVIALGVLDFASKEGG